ncbi:hypothetical protein G9A89_001893 [Geosiphon pyriformis]|nr:hypothetical protein G9A89_001893 [Geosiphon pyriformis]
MISFFCKENWSKKIQLISYTSSSRASQPRVYKSNSFSGTDSKFSVYEKSSDALYIPTYSTSPKRKRDCGSCSGSNEICQVNGLCTKRSSLTPLVSNTCQNGSGCTDGTICESLTNTCQSPQTPEKKKQSTSVIVWIFLGFFGLTLLSICAWRIRRCIQRANEIQEIDPENPRIQIVGRQRAQTGQSYQSTLPPYSAGSLPEYTAENPDDQSRLSGIDEDTEVESEPPSYERSVGELSNLSCQENESNRDSNSPMISRVDTT